MNFPVPGGGTRRGTVIPELGIEWGSFGPLKQYCIVETIQCVLSSLYFVNVCLLLYRIDGVMRTMNPEKLLKTLPIIQNQLDALLDFDVSTLSSVLSNTLSF